VNSEEALADLGCHAMRKHGIRNVYRPVDLRVMLCVVLTVNAQHILYRGIVYIFSVRKLLKSTKYFTNINIRSVYLDLTLEMFYESLIEDGMYLNCLYTNEV
jgi:hypothetical protein